MVAGMIHTGDLDTVSVLVGAVIGGIHIMAGVTLTMVTVGDILITDTEMCQEAIRIET